MLHPSRRLVLSLLAGTILAGPLAGAALAAEKPVLPVDEAKRDSALVKVIAACVAAAKARNFRALAPHLADKIELDYGGGHGVAEMGRRLAKTPQFWDEIIWVLEHGGKFEKSGSFYAPYTFSADTGKLDVFESGVLVEKVKARAEPRPDAPVVAEFDRSVVKVVDWKHSEKNPTPFYRRTDWVAIELADKRKAWIPAKSVRSTVDFRAGFTKMRGVWKMTQFIAGD